MTDLHKSLAAELREAQVSRAAIEPLTARYPDLTVADAYAIQLLQVETAIAEGRHVVGRKVGLTSKAMQEMLGVDEPDFGTLLDDMVVQDGADVDVSGLLQPRVEAEIAFILGRDLVGPVAFEEALAAIESVVPSLEIIDSRVADWNIKLVDTIADNGSSAMAVLGIDRTPLDRQDLRLIGVLLDQNGEVVEHGLGVAALGNPVTCLQWLANKLAEHGDQLHAGEIVLPGSLHRAIDVEAGDVVTATFTNIGSVTVRFVGGGE